MNNKILNAIYIIGLIALIGGMSWRDMHPVARQPSNILHPHYAGPNIHPPHVPNDTAPLLVYQGAFQYAKDGKMTWTSEGMEPHLFPQRQINLIFSFDGFPGQVDETIARIKEVISNWEKTGSSISLLAVAPSSDARKDVKTYAAFLQTLDTAFKREMVIVADIDAAWLHEPQQTSIEMLASAAAGQFMIKVPDTRIPDDLVAALKSFHHSTLLILPSETAPEDLLRYDFGSFSSLVQTAIALDPSKPPPKQELTIGLFPKL